MKQGVYKGYNAGCCDGLEVWGVSCDAPNFQNLVYGINGGGWSHNFSYDAFRDSGGGEGEKIELYPKPLWTRSTARSWGMYAAKVPGTFPVANRDRPISSHDNGTWSRDLGGAGRHRFFSTDDHESPDEVTYVDASRAIYVDGQQKWIAYRKGLFESELYGPDEGNFGDEMMFIDGPRLYQSLYIYDINDDDVSLTKTYAPNNIGWFPEWWFPNSEFSRMEGVFAHLYHPWYENNVLYSLPDNWWALFQPPCNSYCIGREYIVCSSYKPGKTNWGVGRLKLEGSRLTSEGGSHSDGMEVFCSQVESNGVGPVGNIASTFTGDYWIVLPTVRAYIDSSVDNDECWVCAMHKDNNTGTPPNVRIVTGRWLEKVFQNGGGTNEWTDYADGTLSAGEVENTILDVSDSELSSRYTEDWKNIRIRCYNRVYNPATEHSTDLLLFTTQDAVDTYQQTTIDVVADFEGENLNSGLGEAQITFTTGGEYDGAGWVSENSVTYVSDTVINGSYSAKTDPISVNLIQSLILSITFNKVTAGYITFDYRHHNRLWGTPGSGVGTQLSNFPVPENYLDIRLNGLLLTDEMLINEESAATIGNYRFELKRGPEWESGASSRIDNVNTPHNTTWTEDDFINPVSVRIWVEPGTHTLTFTAQRGEDKNQGSFANLYSQIDDLNLGILMIGEDVTSRKRWFYNGEKIQKAEWWHWPFRDDVDSTALTGRLSTEPDFITMDKTGRILYGNPHYVVCLKRREDDDALFELDTDFGEDGYVKFTAYPGLESKTSGGDCDEPVNTYINPDAIADPPWGAMQILPFGSTGDFQLRGMNATLNDATDYPFKSEDWTYTLQNGNVAEEKFSESMNVNPAGFNALWAARCSCWTITENGKVIRGHVEVLWRPTKHFMAYPEGPWLSPPYVSNFENSNNEDISLFGASAARVRDALFLTASEKNRLPKWTMFNRIIANSYCDGLSRYPQYIWNHTVDNDPPDIIPSEEYFKNEHDPDLIGPWRSAQWRLVVARFLPTSGRVIIMDGTSSASSYQTSADCSEDVEGIPTPLTSITFSQTIMSLTFFNQPANTTRTDFDVVDKQNVCCS